MYYMTTFPDFAKTLNQVVEERYTIIQQYLKKELPVKEMLQKYRITRPDLYKYLKRFHLYGKVGLQNIKRGARIPYNKIDTKQEEVIVSLHKKHPYFSSYEMGELIGIKSRTISRVKKRNGLQKSYLPKSKKKNILQQLKMEIQQKKNKHQKSLEKL